mmetsp:Transcript_16430/g.45748  ORF Transcript_16430/g.45748 Transcript_16430/m.45748 type:complete len:287 (+) Transcript_16430:2-862(+)
MRRRRRPLARGSRRLRGPGAGARGGRRGVVRGGRLAIPAARPAAEPRGRLLAAARLSAAGRCPGQRGGQLGLGGVQQHLLPVGRGAGRHAHPQLLGARLRRRRGRGARAGRGLSVAGHAGRRGRRRELVPVRREPVAGARGAAGVSGPLLELRLSLAAGARLRHRRRVARARGAAAQLLPEELRAPAGDHGRPGAGQRVRGAAAHRPAGLRRSAPGAAARRGPGHAGGGGRLGVVAGADDRPRVRECQGLRLERLSALRPHRPHRAGGAATGHHLPAYLPAGRRRG